MGRSVRATESDGGARTNARKATGLRATLFRILACSSVLAAALTGLAASEASAGPPTSVSNVSVSPTSTAAGATTNWTIGFTTSSTGALAYPGASVTVALPAGVSLGSFQGGSVTDTTTGNPLSNSCSGGTTMTCSFDYGYSANAGDVLSVVLTDVTNPTSTGSVSTTVSTSSDTQGVSKSVTITAAKAVSNVSVSPTSTAAGATTNWTIGFTTSTTGALAYPGASLTVALPSGATFGSFQGGSVTDTTTGNPLSNSCSGGTTMTCSFDYGYSANAGDVLSVVLTDVTNPTSTGPASTTVSTSSDTVGSSKSFTVTAAKSVSTVSVSPTSTAVGATTNWKIGFTTSSTGALAYPGASVNLTLPAGTTFGAYEGGTVTDTTTGNPLSNNCNNTSGTTMVCTFNYGYSANAGDVLSVALTDVTNPTSTGSVSTSVSTSSDTLVASKSITLTAAQAVSNLSVSATSTVAGATTNWTIGFTTSSTGALAYPGASVNVTLPAGTTFGAYEGGTVTDTTTGNPLSNNCNNTSGTTMVCTFNYGNPAHAGDVLSVALIDVTNPTSTGSANTTVSTSSDTVASSMSITITAAQAVSAVSVSPTSTAAGATTNWTIGFTTSSTGALAYPGASVNLTLPAGTTFGAYEGGTVTDTTTGNPLSNNCNNTSGTTMVCTFNYGYSANAGDVLSVALTDVTNPTSTGSVSTSVSTSSDTLAASAGFTVTAAQAVSNLSVVPASTAAGSNANWTIGFTASSTGALAYPGGTVTVALPTGTTFGSFDGGSVMDTTTGDQLSDDCYNTSGTVVVCAFNYGNSANAGDVLSVVLNNVTNPTSTGSATTTVTTSSDTVPASESITITGAAGPVCTKLSGTISGTITISKCTPKSTSYVSAAGKASALTSNGTFKWSPSAKTTKVSDTVSSPGRGSCAAGSIERDVVGTVTGGTAKKYAAAGDLVSVRMCQSAAGKLTLVSGTKVNF